jgi:hypothetical protein
MSQRFSYLFIVTLGIFFVYDIRPSFCTTHVGLAFELRIPPLTDIILS